MLLMQSNTELICNIKLTLTFDDTSTKEIFLHDNDFIVLKYRYNGNKDVSIAKINKITTIFNQHDNRMELDNAILVLDIAKAFESKRIHVKTSDILNIRTLSEDIAMYLFKIWDDIDVTDDIFGDIIPTDPNNPIDSDMNVKNDNENIDT